MDMQESNNMNDMKVDNISNFYIILLNTFLQYYKTITHTQNTFLFENIDTTDILSENNQLKLFNELKCKYEQNEKLNNGLNTIYKPDKSINKNIYGLYYKKKLLCKSFSLFSLLIESTHLQITNKKDLKKLCINIIYETV